MRARLDGSMPDQSLHRYGNRIHVFSEGQITEALNYESQAYFYFWGVWLTGHPIFIYRIFGY